MKPGSILSNAFLFVYVITATLVFSCLEKRSASIKLEETKEHGFDDPAWAAEYEFNIIKDKKGRIPANIRKMEVEQARSIYAKQLKETGTSFYNYTMQGPGNIGGRTRCVAYDVRYNGTTNRILLAGGVTGGIYKSTDDGSNWTRKSSTSAIYSVTSLAQDTRPGHQDTWYYSTGEYLGSDEHHSAPYQGDGIYKSMDNGETWTRLPASNTGVFENHDRREDVIWRVLVNPVNGHIYMAATGAIYRSTNEGATWQAVLTTSSASINPFQSTDIIITGSGILYAAIAGYAPGDIDGVWTSVSGNTGSWTRIAGEGPGGSPAGWYAEDGYGRIVLAPVQSNPNLVYAYVQTFTNLCSGLSRARLYKWDNNAGSWTDLSNNLPDCTGVGQAMDMQGGYNMMIHIKPDNPNVIFIGAQNLYRSTNGFTSAANTMQIGGYNNMSLHPDMHWIAFKPGNPSTMICATDGGMSRTTNNVAANVQWQKINNNYITTQFYYVAVDPLRGSNKLIGGTQDNGTLANIYGDEYFETITGGDGISVGYSKSINDKVYQYTSYQGGAINRRDGATGVTYSITPSGITGGTTFYTLFRLDDDNTEYLYFTRSRRFFRNLSASTASPDNWTEMSGINSVLGEAINFSAIATTRGSYQSSTGSLFIGTDDGKVFRLDDPVHANPITVPVNITGPAFEPWGNISSIAVNPRNDDTVLVTRSNYGGLSIWWTGNANDASPTWINVERNLTLPSIRSSAIAVTATGVEYFVGTSVGLFHSVNPVLNNWTQESPDGIGNAIVSSLSIRAADNRLLAGTYGNGLWTSAISPEALPLTLFNFKGKLQNNNVLLEWETGNEVNTGSFEIQRSYDGAQFLPVGFVAAAGNSSAILKYRFLDRTPATVKNFYRLKMIDMDGQYTFSKIIVIKNEGVQSIYVTNPFQDRIEIRFSKIPRGKVEVSLFDISGKLVGREEISNTIHASVSLQNAVGLLRNGAYILQLKADGEKYVFELMKY